MFREKDITIVAQFLTKKLFHPDFLLNPERDGFEKRPNAGRSASQIRVQDTVELCERLFVKSDKIHLADTQFPFPETILDRALGKRGVVLFACEAFFLRGSNDPPIAHQARGAV